MNTNTVDSTVVTAATKPVKAPKATKAVKTVKPAKVAKAPAAPKTDSKKARAIPIVQAGLVAKTARKEILAKLQSDLGLGAAGANTYYQNIKSGSWK